MTTKTSMATKQISISDIDRKAVPHMRYEGLRHDYVAGYAELFDKKPCPLPPVVLFRDGDDGPYYVGDGWHRIAAAEMAGKKAIAADVRDGGPSDALWFAIGADRTRHGIPLTKDDVWDRIAMALKTFADKSTTQIAEQVGCSQGYVVKVRQQIEWERQEADERSRQVIPGNNLPDSPTAKVIGKDGKRYPARKAKKSTPSLPAVSNAQRQTDRVEAAMGVLHARAAIDCLKEIRNDDPERDEALRIVEDWIAERRTAPTTTSEDTNHDDDTFRV